MTNELGDTSPSGENNPVPFNLHIANIVSFDYEPIHCMKLNDRHTKLALFRGGETPVIQVWDLRHTAVLETVLHDLERVNDKVSVESLAWIHDRLFSCGLHGFIVEHNLVTRKRKKQYMATSGPVWNLAANPDRTLLGAVTEDGFVNIFQVMDEELQFLRVLDRQEGRILCLSWSPCGKFIATGSVDNVRVWDVERRHAMHRLCTGRSKKNETIVWSVLFLNNMTIASGDSRGLVLFWDGRLGVLKSKIYTHRADILCMALGPGGNTIYVSGVDPTVVLLQRSSNKWIKSHQRNMHTNDVLCLETKGAELISGGVDCDLTFSIPPRRNLPQVIKKIPPLPHGSRIFVSKTGDRVLVQEPKELSIWQLPRENQELVKLVEFRSRDDQVIDSACFSPAGNMFGYSGNGKFQFFRLVECVDGKIIPVKLKKVVHTEHQSLSSATVANGSLFNSSDFVWSLHFRNETQAIAISWDGSVLQAIEIHEHTDTYVCKPELYLEDFMEIHGISHVSVRPGGENVAVASADGNIYVFSFTHELSITECNKLPKHNSAVTTLDFHPFLPYVLVTYSDHTVLIYNFQVSQILFHEGVGGPRGGDGANERSGECDYSITSTSWSADGSKVLFQELNRLHIMEFSSVPPGNLSLPDEPAAKKSRRDSSAHKKFSSQRGCSSPVPAFSQAEEWISNKLYMTKLSSLSEKQRQRNTGRVYKFVDWKKFDCEKNYKYVAFVAFLEAENQSRDILVIEVKPATLLSKLPPAFARKRFGF